MATTQRGRRTALLAGLQAGGERAAESTAAIRAALIAHDGRIARVAAALGVSVRTALTLVQAAELVDLAAALRATAGVPGPRTPQAGRAKPRNG